MLDVYQEQVWEIHDPQNARIVAIFFDQGYADFFAGIANFCEASSALLVRTR